MKIAKIYLIFLIIISTIGASFANNIQVFGTLDDYDQDKLDFLLNYSGKLSESLSTDITNVQFELLIGGKGIKLLIDNPDLINKIAQYKPQNDKFKVYLCTETLDRMPAKDLKKLDAILYGVECRTKLQSYDDSWYKISP